MTRVDGEPASRMRDHRVVEPKGRLRILIADDDPYARRMVRDALQEAGHLVVAEAADGAEAVQLALHYRPDVVLMDVLMPGTDGIAAVQRIRAKAPDVRIVMLSTSDDAEVAMMGLRAGASGYLVKTLDVVRLPGILERAAVGEAALDPRVAASLIEELRSPALAGAGSRPVQSNLTDREWEVLDLLDAGLSPADIADRFVVSPDTVRTHIKSLHRKLDVHTRDELAAATRRLRAPSSPASPAT